MGKRIATEEKQTELIQEIHNLNQEILSVSEYKNAAQAAATTATTKASEASTSATNASQKVDEANTILSAIRNEYGYPFTAATAADMTDTDKIYVYVGNETGYTNGNWYYNNGTAWVSGGVYNNTAFETDKTLTISGAAADAKVTGNIGTLAATILGSLGGLKTSGSATVTVHNDYRYGSDGSLVADTNYDAVEFNVDHAKTYILSGAVWSYGFFDGGGTYHRVGTTFHMYSNEELTVPFYATKVCMTSREDVLVSVTEVELTKQAASIDYVDDEFAEKGFILDEDFSFAGTAVITGFPLTLEADKEYLIDLNITGLDETSAVGIRLQKALTNNGGDVVKQITSGYFPKIGEYLMPIKVTSAEAALIKYVVLTRLYNNKSAAGHIAFTTGQVFAMQKETADGLGIDMESETVSFEAGVTKTENYVLHGFYIPKGSTVQVCLKCNKSAPFSGTSGVQLWKPNTSFIKVFTNAMLNQWVDVELTNGDYTGDYITAFHLTCYDNYLTENADFKLCLRYHIKGQVADNTDKIVKLENHTDNINDYYFANNYLPSKIAEIETNQKFVNGISFAFFTDPHFRYNSLQSKYIIPYVLDKTTVPFAICGGDYVWAYGANTLVTEAESILADYYGAIGKDRFFAIRGNHDFTIKLAAGSNEGYTAQSGEVYNAISRPIERFVDSMVADGNYSYIDIAPQKTRIFLINSVSSQNSDSSVPWGNYDTVGISQVQWLLEHMTDVTNYNFIFISHIPVDANIDGYESDQKILLDIFVALKNKTTLSTTYDGNTVTADFTNSTNNAICWIGGHNHKDRSHRENGFLSITTTGDYRSTDDGDTRNAGQINEQAIDFFSIDYDAGTIKTVRIGSGNNRQWNINE